MWQYIMKLFILLLYCIFIVYILMSCVCSSEIELGVFWPIYSCIHPCIVWEKVVRRMRFCFPWLPGLPCAVRGWEAVCSASPAACSSSSWPPVWRCPHVWCWKQLRRSHPPSLTLPLYISLCRPPPLRADDWYVYIECIVHINLHLL